MLNKWQFLQFSVTMQSSLSFLLNVIKIITFLASIFKLYLSKTNYTHVLIHIIIIIIKYNFIFMFANCEIVLIGLTHVKFWDFKTCFHHNIFSISWNIYCVDVWGWVGNSHSRWKLRALAGFWITLKHVDLAVLLLSTRGQHCKSNEQGFSVAQEMLIWLEPFQEILCLPFQPFSEICL